MFPCDFGLCTWQPFQGAEGIKANSSNYAGTSALQARNFEGGADMFGFLANLGTPTVNVAHYGEGLVHFKHGKRLGQAEQFHAYGKLPTGEKIPLVLEIMELRSNGIYLGKLIEPLESVAILEKAFLPDPNRPKEQMYYKVDPQRATSHMRSYTIRSESFANFKAITVEVSPEKGKVILQGPLQEGKVIGVHLDLPNDMPAIKIKATVEWCKEKDKKTYVASLLFSEMREEDRTALRNHLTALKTHRALQNDQP